MTQIPLSKTGKYVGLYEVVVDDCDADLAELNWSVKHGCNMFYGRRVDYAGGSRVTKYIHRVIVMRIVGRPFQENEMVDHIDGDGLNNCRSNLRIATNRQNQQNRFHSGGKYPKGVKLHKRNQKYEASIQVNGNRKYLGGFDTPEKAHAAYCVAATKEFGEFANFGHHDKAA